jgi:hypothetical protein
VARCLISRRWSSFLFELTVMTDKSKKATPWKPPRRNGESVMRLLALPRVGGLWVSGEIVSGCTSKTLPMRGALPEKGRGSGGCRAGT